MTFSDLPDFNQINPGLCGETLLWRRSPVFPLLAAGNKSFLLRIFGLAVSFDSTRTTRQNVFRVTSVAFGLCKTLHTPAFLCIDQEEYSCMSLGDMFKMSFCSILQLSKPGNNLNVHQ